MYILILDIILTLTLPLTLTLTLTLTYAIQTRKNMIIAHYDRKKTRVQKIRDEKAHEIETELERVKEDFGAAKEGYMKDQLETQMSDLLKALQSMDEVHTLSISLSLY